MAKKSTKQNQIKEEKDTNKVKEETIMEESTTIKVDTTGLEEEMKTISDILNDSGVDVRPLGGGEEKKSNTKDDDLDIKNVASIFTKFLRGEEFKKIKYQFKDKEEFKQTFDSVISNKLVIKQDIANWVSNNPDVSLEDGFLEIFKKQKSSDFNKKSSHDNKSEEQKSDNTKSVLNENDEKFNKYIDIIQSMMDGNKEVLMKIILKDNVNIDNEDISSVFEMINNSEEPTDEEIESIETLVYKIVNPKVIALVKAIFNADKLVDISKIKEEDIQRRVAEILSDIVEKEDGNDNKLNLDFLNMYDDINPENIIDITIDLLKQINIEISIDEQDENTEHITDKFDHDAYVEKAKEGMLKILSKYDNAINKLNNNSEHMQNNDNSSDESQNTNSNTNKTLSFFKRYSKKNKQTKS